MHLTTALSFTVALRLTDTGRTALLDDLSARMGHRSGLRRRR
jgi:hypothetical protein